MHKTQKTKIQKITEMLNSPLKSGVIILIMNEEEILIEYNGKAYNQDSIKIKEGA